MIPDPHAVLLAQWHRLDQDYQTINGDTPEGAAVHDNIPKVEEVLRTVVPTKPQGVAAQYEAMVRILMEDGKYAGLREDLALPMIEAFRAGLAAVGVAPPLPKPDRSLAVLFDGWATY